MFIQKDLRKIPKILEDAVDCSSYDAEQDPAATTEPRVKRPKVVEPLRDLKLSRRTQEFQGSVKILCRPKYLPKLTQLQNLNLFDCGISSLEQIGIFEACPYLKLLNLGRNLLTSLPEELSKLSGSLQQLWLEDNQLTGPLPQCVANLHRLESLRVPNNQITRLPENIGQLVNLRTLVVDRNPLENGLPEHLYRLRNLKELYARHAQIIKLPRRLPGKLQIMQLSSNPLQSLDVLVMAENHLEDLKEIYVNGCQLQSIPDGIVSRHAQLRRLVLCHNPPLKTLPLDIWHAIRGRQDLMMEGGCEIIWQPNPQLSEGATREDIEAPSEDTGIISEEEEEQSNRMEGIEVSTE